MERLTQVLDDSLLLTSATDQAAWLACGNITSEHLTLATLEAIDRRDGQLNSYTCLQPDEALRAARASDQRRSQGLTLSPLDGLTLAVSDNIDVAGMVTRCGMDGPKMLSPALQDAFVVERLRAAGMVILGKLHVQESPSSDVLGEAYPVRCYNPHKLSHAAGGLNGGCGAAVAAGLCSFAVGTDTLGALRIPASYCGVTAIKPSAGTVSTVGSFRLSRRLDHVGPLAKTPQDLYLILPYMMAIDPNCVGSRPLLLPKRPVRVRDLSLGAFQGLDQWGLIPEIATTYDAALELFAEFGAHIQNCDWGDYPGDQYQSAGLTLCEAEIGVEYGGKLLGLPNALPEKLQRMISRGQKIMAADVIVADRLLDESVSRLQKALVKNDFLLMPTSLQAAFNFKEPVPALQTCLTSIANFSGHPAVSVPMGWSKDGLPLGLQIIGNHGSDMQLLRLAQWFEKQAGLNMRPLHLNHETDQWGARLQYGQLH
ncbi:amidase [Aestuariicella hydrocarbonica]|uniref:Amidase n=1 Tax=Pseudomaricurvus hydrocarbonicus TaxID=1470433 RepID=A0A9E5MN59_9GAMM|nr:amidase [Aestuariicella hydrocarbonica]NHO67272.1 amidase [Aestuariicella hydrocarbonica]